MNKSIARSLSSLSSPSQVPARGAPVASSPCCARRSSSSSTARPPAFLPRSAYPWPSRALLPASRPAAFFTAGCCSLAQLVQSSRACFPMAAREVFGSPRPGFPGLRALALCPELPVPLGALPARSERAAPFVAPRPYPALAHRSPSHGRLPQAAVSSML